MHKTTLYLPQDLKAVRESRKPRPRIPLTGEGLGDPTAALRVDDLLRQGFGRS